MITSQKQISSMKYKIIIFTLVFINSFAIEKSSFEYYIKSKESSQRQAFAFTETAKQVDATATIEKKEEVKAPILAPIVVQKVLTGGYRKFIFGYAFGNVGSARAKETFTGTPRATYDLFKSDITYADIFQIGIAAGTANNRLRAEFEFNFLSLGLLGGMSSSNTQLKSGSSIKIDDSIFMMYGFNLFWNGYVKLYQGSNWDIFAGLGVGIGVMMPINDKITTNLVLPATQFILGYGLTQRNMTKINIIYKVMMMNLSFYNSFAFTDNANTLQYNRSVDNSYVTYDYILNMIGIEFLSF